MGNWKMKNLEQNNILSDEGSLPEEVIRDIEKFLCVKLPHIYTNFISGHNGAYLKNDIFDYYDPNRADGINGNGITFLNAEKIPDHIKLLKYDEDPDWGPEYLFEDGLIPFGDNGGGDLICFDYRKDRETDNPPIVIWNHDMGLEHRVVFIAPNFEEFINMLHEPNDED